MKRFALIVIVLGILSGCSKQPAWKEEHPLNPAIVAIRSETESPDEASGTGVIIAENTILTARHVVLESYENTSSESYYVFIQGEWTETELVAVPQFQRFGSGLLYIAGDFALLKADTKQIKPLSFAQKLSSPGDTLHWYRFGSSNKFAGALQSNNDTLDLSFTRDALSIWGVEFLVVTGRLLKFSGFNSILPGSSGSPILNNKNEVAGIVSSCNKAEDGCQGFSVHHKSFSELLKRSANIRNAP